MTWLIVTAISIVEALIHYALHHKAQVAAVLAGALIWAGRRSHIPALAPNPGRRVARGAARKAVRQAAKARKQATA